jgi:hypothetical protein
MGQLSYYETDVAQVKTIDTNQIDSQLENIKGLVDKSFAKLSKVGDYELSSVTVKVDLKAGILVVTAEGSVELKWSKPGSKPD